VGKIGRLLREKYPNIRVSRKAPVYFAAVLEYLCAELHDLSAGFCKEDKRKRIKPKHIADAIKSDFEFSYLLSDVEIVEEERFNSIRMLDKPLKDKPYAKRRRIKKSPSK